MMLRTHPDNLPTNNISISAKNPSTNNLSTDHYFAQLRQGNELKFIEMALAVKEHINSIYPIGSGELTNVLINEILEKNITLGEVKRINLIQAALFNLTNKSHLIEIAKNTSNLFEAMGQTLVLKQAYPQQEFFHKKHILSNVDELNTFNETMDNLIAQANQDANYLTMKSRHEAKSENTTIEINNYLEANKKNIYLFLFRYAENMDAILLKQNQATLERYAEQIEMTPDKGERKVMTANMNKLKSAMFNHSYADAVYDNLFAAILSTTPNKEINATFKQLFQELNYTEDQKQYFIDKYAVYHGGIISNDIKLSHDSSKLSCDSSKSSCDSSKLSCFSLLSVLSMFPCIKKTPPETTDLETSPGYNYGTFPPKKRYERC